MKLDRSSVSDQAKVNQYRVFHNVLRDYKHL